MTTTATMTTPEVRKAIEQAAVCLQECGTLLETTTCAMINGDRQSRAPLWYALKRLAAMIKRDLSQHCDALEEVGGEESPTCSRIEDALSMLSAVEALAREQLDAGQDNTGSSEAPSFASAAASARYTAEWEAAEDAHALCQIVAKMGRAALREV